MKFALIDNIKTTAIKGAKGICPNCSSELIAKCGDFKENHWAHKGIRNCDSWWENETEWHRNWKGNFTNDWQEVILTDETTGEKHIADIRSSYGLTIEFQHSYITPIERTTRERFYKKMVWVVDGTRLKRDYPRLQKAIGSFRVTKTRGIYLVDFIDECFPSAWLGSSVPVIFDYKGTDVINDPSDLRNYLYCLYPKSNVRESVVEIISRQSFIQSVTTGNFLQEKRGQEQQTPKPQTNSLPTIPTRPSQYVFDRGRYVKRKRF
jgi:competence protein CoiA